MKLVTKEKERFGLHRVLGVFVVLALGALAVGTASGQAPPVATGLTTLQQQTQSGVLNTCAHLPANPTVQGVINLKRSCDTMVTTSVGVQGQNPTVTSPIGKDTLGQQWEEWSGNQANAQNPVSTQAVYSRLLDLRAGAGGFLMSQNGSGTGIERNTALADFYGVGARGGAASADPGLEGPWSGFVTLSYNGGSVDQTGLQTGYGFDNFGILAGVDYRFSNQFVLGGALSYQYTNSDYDRSMGSVKASTYSGVLYGTYYMDRWYVDGTLSYGYINYETTRNINIPGNQNSTPNNGPTNVPIIGQATADPNGDQWSATIGAGYNYEINRFGITPFARLGYIQVNNKAFQETETQAGIGLAVNERTLKSLQSALGAKFSTTLSTASGVFIPYFTAQWLHEFENSNPDIAAKFVNDPNNLFFFLTTEDPDQDYGVFNLGVSGQFQRGISAFVQVYTAQWLANVNVWGATAGVRVPF